MEYTATASSDSGSALVAGAQPATKTMTEDAIAARVRRFAMQDRLFLLVTFKHLEEGLQVVIEDYVHGHALKFVALIAIKYGTALLAIAAVFAVLKVAFG